VYVEVFIQGQGELFYKTGIQSCRNDATIALKLAEIMWKNKINWSLLLCCVSLYMRPETFGTTLVINNITVSSDKKGAPSNLIFSHP